MMRLLGLQPLWIHICDCSELTARSRNPNPAMEADIRSSPLGEAVALSMFPLLLSDPQHRLKSRSSLRGTMHSQRWESAFWNSFFFVGGGVFSIVTSQQQHSWFEPCLAPFFVIVLSVSSWVLCGSLTSSHSPKVGMSWCSKVALNVTCVGG